MTEVYRLRNIIATYRSEIGGVFGAAGLGLAAAQALGFQQRAPKAQAKQALAQYQQMIMMPIYQLLCLDCGHRFGGMVFAGTQEPEKWICSQCGGDRAQIRADSVPVPHPLEVQHGAGCPCCSGGTRGNLI